uniref:UBN2 domain-containing protein n=1 Tax=Vitis vinifera TaxID=29760 RepID=A5AMU4_VITVI|nr:hypothetical protein VITISV_008297 [Vitis vinifera]
MYSIFNAISTDEFRRIATCTSAKEAWDILQVTHEGTNAVKVSKLQMLTSRFETIRMDDHETFGEFNAKLMDIVNSSFNLGEPISNSKVVRKILRSLPERFRAKVTAIEESKDVDSLKIDELVGSLQTFEMTLVSPRKAKGIALKAIKEESLSSESEDDEKMSEGELTKFAKKFKKYMKFRKAKKESNDVSPQVVVQLLRTALNCWYNCPPPRWWPVEKPPTCINISFASAHCSASTSHGIAPMAVPSWCTGHCAPVLCIGTRVLVGCLSDAPSGHGIAPMVFLAGSLAQGLCALVLARGGARPHHAPCCCSHGLHATHVVEPMCACSVAMPGCLWFPWCGQGSSLVRSRLALGAHLP